MRVIAGSARGRKLLPPDGYRVRPTADRVKEALFSVLVSKFGTLEGLTVLDLFSGSGGLGIEALSRGAAKVFFVDSHPESIALTRKNLQLTGFDHVSATLLQIDACKALANFSAEARQFDIILADPPYADKKLAERVLNLLATPGTVADNGVIVFETETRFELRQPDSFLLTGRKVYADTALCFFELAE